MKKNLYTNAVESIKAPEELIKKSVNNLSNATTDNKVIIMKKNNHFKLKLTSIIAASLVLLLTLSVIIFEPKDTAPAPESKPYSHPFVISVQAAGTSTDDTATRDEINHESYVNINEIKNIGYFSEASYLDKTKETITLERIGKNFTIDLVCTGENIESITYTAHNTFLSYMENYRGLISKVKLTEEETVKYYAYCFMGGFDHASSCTFDYNCQPKSSLDHKVSEDCLDGTIPLQIGFYFSVEKGKHVAPTIDDCDMNKIFTEEFNARSDNYALDVTANFTDGTSTTKTLKFKCENRGNHLYLSAIEDIS